MTKEKRIEALELTVSSLDKRLAILEAEKFEADEAKRKMKQFAEDVREIENADPMSAPEWDYPRVPGDERFAEDVPHEGREH